VTARDCPDAIISRRDCPETAPSVSA